MTDGKNGQDPSSPGKDAPGSLREVFRPRAELDVAVEDSFDRTVLTKSPNTSSMGRLGKYDVIKLTGQGGMRVVLKGSTSRSRGMSQSKCYLASWQQAPQPDVNSRAKVAVLRLIVPTSLRFT